MKKPSKIQDHYVLIYQPNHSKAVAAGYVPEHILIAEKVLGRALFADEEVRHINGDPRDNRPTNLEIISIGNNYKSQSVEDTANKIPRKVSGKTFIPCRYQRVCWKTVRAPIARENGVYLPYICSWQIEGDIYDCSHFWRFFEGEETEMEKK
jgi:hypothetical protein